MIAEYKSVGDTEGTTEAQIRNPQFPIRNWHASLLVLLFFLALTVAMTWPWARPHASHPTAIIHSQRVSRGRDGHDVAILMVGIPPPVVVG